MVFIVALSFVALTFGALAPTVFKSRPRVAVAVVVLLPPLLLLWRYLAFARANDWEGMGALALVIVSAAWVTISFGAGVTTLTVRRHAARPTSR